jgi:hypothetical protein
MKLQRETTQAIEQFTHMCYGTVAYQDYQKGRLHGEPLFVAMDAAIRYAKAYRKQFGQSLKDDYALGPEFLSWITGIRGLCNGPGAVAMETNGRDSKDNGLIESLFWSAMELSGFTEDDL